MNRHDFRVTAAAHLLVSRPDARSSRADVCDAIWRLDPLYAKPNLGWLTSHWAEVSRAVRDLSDGALFAFRPEREWGWTTGATQHPVYPLIVLARREQYRATTMRNDLQDGNLDGLSALGFTDAALAQHRMGSYLLGLSPDDLADRLLALHGDLVALPLLGPWGDLPMLGVA